MLSARLVEAGLQSRQNPRDEVRAQQRDRSLKAKAELPVEQLRPSFLRAQELDQVAQLVLFEGAAVLGHG